jgi:hypothetical protein
MDFKRDCVRATLQLWDTRTPLDKRNCVKCWQERFNSKMNHLVKRYQRFGGACCPQKQKDVRTSLRMDQSGTYKLSENLATTSGRQEGDKKHVESSWNVMAHGNARQGKWRGNWRMEWVASTLHTTWEHGVSCITTADAPCITTADAPTSAASSRLNWRSPPI